MQDGLASLLQVGVGWGAGGTFLPDGLFVPNVQLGSPNLGSGSGLESTMRPGAVALDAFFRAAFLREYYMLIPACGGGVGFNPLQILHSSI